MSISKKLKGQNQNILAELPTRPANACENKNCTGTYMVRRVFLRAGTDEPCRMVCFYLRCHKCGRIKSGLDANGVRRIKFYCFVPGGGISVNMLDFYVPRQFICKAVFDSQGEPVLDAQGAQVTQYMPDMKKEFLQKLFALIDFKSGCEQCFTPQQVLTS